MLKWKTNTETNIQAMNNTSSNEQCEYLAVTYIAVEKAALLLHLAVNKLGMTAGTCQCSDSTYKINSKLLFPLSLKLREFCPKLFAT